jgi:DNA-binding winged helix-turn-helix (wHTH) protein
MANQYRFDDIEIDTQSFRLLKAGKVVQAEPKTLNLLIFLVENRGRLLPRQEIIDAVWKEAFVTDHVLNRAMGQLRKGLGDDAKEPRYIETVPTRGYRFIAQIDEENGRGTSNGTPAAIADEFSALPGSVPVAKRRGIPRLVPLAIFAAVALVCALIVAFVVLREQSHFEYDRPGKTVQITTSPGTSNYYPTFSPDGTAVAYSTDSGKGFEVFVHQLTPEGREIQRDMAYLPARRPKPSTHRIRLTPGMVTR